MWQKFIKSIGLAILELINQVKKVLLTSSKINVLIIIIFLALFIMVNNVFVNMLGIAQLYN